ncbi:Ca(2+)-dependent cysteine protease [Globomyces sp. JEL0801]|nr:Ca(2+)-dependent cysteine protease [Globomyces sp. JEL0801]
MFSGLKEIAKKIDGDSIKNFVEKSQQSLNPTHQQQSTTHSHHSDRSGPGGKTKALLIGINYFNTKAELKGCINDVQNVKNYITSQVKYDEIRILTDDQKDPKLKPTKANIIEAFKWLVQNAKAGDSFFLHYSGHGATAAAKGGDEDDGQNETICPVDYETAGMIVDDEMNHMLVQTLPKGAKLNAIFDCCHSGSMLDLPYTYEIDGNSNLKIRNNTKEALKLGLAAFQALERGDKREALRGAFEAISLIVKPHQQNTELTDDKKQILKLKSSEADVFMYSGCMDNQTSADAHINGNSTGAMSWALLKVLHEKPGPLTLAELLKELRANLHGKYKQIPQLSVSHEMDVKNMKFSIV